MLLRVGATIMMHLEKRVSGMSNDLMEAVAKVIHDAKRRHLRSSTVKIPKGATDEQRQVLLKQRADDEIAHRTIGELQSDLAKLFPDQDRFNRFANR